LHTQVSSGEDNEPRVIVTAVAHRPAAAGTDSVPNATKECEALFEASLQRWQQRKAKRLDYLQKQPAPASKVTYYDVFEPEWCESIWRRLLCSACS
jgi:hypothetical protein